MTKKRVAIIGCSKLKDQPAPGGTLPARRLYAASPLFRKALAWAEAHADMTLIASAKHGVVGPDQEIAHYDLALDDLSAAARREWGERARDQLARHLRRCGEVKLVLLVGETYASEILRGHRWAAVEQPLKGLGIGRRLRALTPTAVVR